MTTMTTWAPLQELDLMQRQMLRLFEDIGLKPSPLPSADVYETEGEYVVELEVPGYAEKELGIEVLDHTLTITGARAEEKEIEEKAFRIHERLQKHFARRFTLPIQADTAHVKATFEKGVLAVHAPKVAGAKPRKVTIARP